MDPSQKQCAYDGVLCMHSCTVQLVLWLNENFLTLHHTLLDVKISGSTTPTLH